MSTILDVASTEAVAAAGEWRLLSMLLRRPTPSVLAEIARLSRDVARPDLEALAAAAPAVSESSYLAVLGPGSTISPRIVAYRTMEDPGWILADILRYYGVFAFRAPAEDPPDHLSVAADFVAYLHLKEAFARAGGDDEACAVTLQARDRFVRDHLSPVAAPLAKRLAAAGFAHLAAVARAVAERVPPPVRAAGTTSVAEEGCGSCAIAWS